MTEPISAPVRPKLFSGPALGFCLLLVVMVFFVFGQTARHDFINFDDNDYVYANPVVQKGMTWEGVAWAFRGAHAENWHPLTWLSHMLDCQIYGLRPGRHHLTNVLLHALAAASLFLVLRDMTGAWWRSAFVAAVFAIHPLRVESVAWISERKDVLSGLFFILTLGAYVRYARNGGGIARYAWVTLFFVLGLLSKPMLVTVPVVLLLLDFWPLQRNESPGKLILEKLPLLLLSAGSCVITLAAQTHLAGPNGAPVPLSMRSANALVSTAIYLWQMIYPARLALIYPYAFGQIPAATIYLSAMAVAAVSGVAVWQRKRQPWLGVGWLWYLVMLTPVIGIIQVGHQAHADRYTYLPQIGIYIAIAWTVDYLTQNSAVLREGARLAAVASVVVLMCCAWKQTTYWQNSETIWSHTAAVTEANDFAHMNLGAVLMQKGDFPGAIAEFQRGLEINPNVAEGQYNLGGAYLQAGQVNEAVPRFQEALRINPDFAPAHFSLANILMQAGQTDAAISEYRASLKNSPENPDAEANLGNAFLRAGRFNEAIAAFRAALKFRPDLAQFENNLGYALMEKGQTDEAIEHFKSALRLRPDYNRAAVNLDHAMAIKTNAAQLVPPPETN